MTAIISYKTFFNEIYYLMRFGAVNEELKIAHYVTLPSPVNIK